MRIQIPHLGTIKLKRDGASKLGSADSTSLNVDGADDSVLHGTDGKREMLSDAFRLQPDVRGPSAAEPLNPSTISNFTPEEEHLSSLGFDSDWTLQGVDMALFDSFIMGTAWTEGQ